MKLYLLLGLSLFLGGVAAAVGFTVSEVNKTLEVVTQDPHQIPDVTPVNRSYEEKEARGNRTRSRCRRTAEESRAAFA